MIAIPGGVLCCGNLVQDILVRPVEKIVFDTTVWVDSIELSLGGNAASTSYALATLGAPVRILGYLGAVGFGESMLEQLRSAGVDVSALVIRPEVPTATTVGLVNTAGARAFLHQPGASLHAFPDGVDFVPERIAGCSHFHLANPFSLALLRPQAGEVSRRARAAGLTTSIDAGWDSRGEWMAVVGPCLPNLDLLFVNQDEARHLSGMAGIPEAARFFQEHGVRSVVVKGGSNGCTVFEADAAMHVPAFRVEAVDSTGAGDCFAGAFLAGLHHGMDAHQTARLANAAGALSVSRIGAVTGLLPLADTRRWMEEEEAAAQRAANDGASDHGGSK